MSSKTDPLYPPNHHPTTSFRWKLRRGRKRPPTVRLGGKKRRRGFSYIRLCNKAKLRWLRLKYLFILKKLEKQYEAFVKNMAEGRAAVQSLQQQMIQETYFDVPIMGLAFAGF